MNTMSRSLFTDSSNVGAVGIGLPLGSGIGRVELRAAAPGGQRQKGYQRET